jgi:hypothetical protein
MEVIQEAKMKQDSMELPSCQNLILDACKCTGNCEE